MKAQPPHQLQIYEERTVSWKSFPPIIDLKNWIKISDYVSIFIISAVIEEDIS